MKRDDYLDMKELLFGLKNEIADLKELYTRQYNGEYIGMREAASFLKISISTMQKISAAKKVAKYKPHGKVLFKKSDLMKYLIKSRVKGVNEFYFDRIFSKPEPPLSSNNID